MKKKMALAVMALAVSAMAGSAFAASETVPTMAKPAINLVELAKEKGISVDQLIAQLKKEGKIMQAATVSVKADENGNLSASTQKAVSLEQLAKERGITVEELMKQLEKEGKLTAIVTTTAPVNLVEVAKEQGITIKELIEQMKQAGQIPDDMTVAIKLDQNGNPEKATLTKIISHEELAKQRGITVEELMKQLEKEGKITKAVATPVTSNQN